jgi:glycosyltransferase involved in cell wall biosynthesis
VTQTFPPDPAAVGQHMADLAMSLGRKGHMVTVLTADRGYDDAAIQYLREEVTPAGILIRRLPRTSFGKATVLHRLAAILSFICQAGARCLLQRDLGMVVFSTSPPFVGVVAAMVGAIRKVPIVFWAMDLNPDQLVALGKLSKRSLITRFLRSVNRWILHQTAAIIALDHLMAQRLRHEAGWGVKIAVIPPWSPDRSLCSVPHEQNGFRTRYGLQRKTVIMYSGNHTPSNPLTTLLDAAVVLQGCARLQFVFVGSGTAKREIEQYITNHSLTNVLSLPYQEKSTLSESLSAADVHVVSLGARMAGIIHPCKVYGAMAVGRPILYFGPSPSHVTAILDEWQNGWTISHGDVQQTVAVLRRIAEVRDDTLNRMGQRGRAAVDSKFDPTALCEAVCHVVEAALTSARDY